MILGMSTASFTLFHVILSLIGIVSGLIVMAGMWARNRLDAWTALFLATTVATSVTGFLFHSATFGPPHVIGLISLLLLVLAILARYSYHLAGSWRWIYIVTAMLALFADSPDLPARIIYSRDINERGIGFVTRERLPLGYGGILSLPGPHPRGQVFNIPCTLYRCRLAAPGWYEGALHFNRDQTAFRAQELIGDQEDITDLFDTDADRPE